jgi:hypothetical protein
VEEDFTESIGELHVWHDSLLSSFVLLNFALYFLIYRPMINQLAKKTISAWEMTKLIPQDYGDHFKSLKQVVFKYRNELKRLSYEALV